MLNTTDRTQQQHAWQTKAQPAIFSDLFDGNNRALLQWLQGTQTLSNEILGLAQARIGFAMEAWSALLACRNAEQLVEYQRRFTAKAIERCAEELSTLSQLALKAGSAEPPK